MGIVLKNDIDELEKVLDILFENHKKSLMINNKVILGFVKLSRIFFNLVLVSYYMQMNNSPLAATETFLKREDTILKKFKVKMKENKQIKPSQLFSKEIIIAASYFVVSKQYCNKVLYKGNLISIIT